jgi:hypothetical protein
MIDLTTCVKGQKLRLRNKEIIEYSGRSFCSDGAYNHVAYRNAKRFTYADNGSYFYGGHDERDVIEILPLETTKPAPHPSIAWWESCPWITDRKPAREDGDIYGRVHVKASEGSQILTSNWDDVMDGETWIHIWHWRPPAFTDREQALQLLDNHQDGWKPTTEQWLVIRKGLEAS